MTNPSYAKTNQLLAALPDLEFKRLLPHLEATTLAAGDSLQEAHGELSHFYFPTSSVISILQLLEPGAAAEISLVGKEGGVGISLVLGDTQSNTTATVQSGGGAVRLPADVLQREFKRGGALQGVLLRYIEALFVQAAQTAACNRHHTLDKRLCRWLLLTLDRTNSIELHMTQQRIAYMLGVRREAVVVAARKLQLGGLISYNRGHIVVLDRDGLATQSCQCYEKVKHEYERLFGAPVAPTVIRAEPARTVVADAAM